MRIIHISSALVALALVCPPARASAPAEAAASPAEDDFSRTLASVAERLARSPRDRATDHALLTLQLAASRPSTDETDTREMDRLLAALSASTPDKELAQDVITLRKQFAARRQAVETAALKEVERAISEAAAACASASAPAELDAHLVALARHARSLRPETSTELARARQRANEALRFATRWQDYLAARQQRNKAKLDEILRDLSAVGEGQLLPRSRILELQAPAPNAADSEDSSMLAASIVARIEKAREYPEFLALARQTRRSDGYARDRSLNNIAPLLEALVQERQRVIHGSRLAPDINLLNSQLFSRSADAFLTDAAEDSLFAFRRQTRLLLLARLVPESTKLDPGPDESPEDFALRVAEQFATAGRWRELRDTLESIPVLFPGGRAPLWMTQDIQAITSFLAGENLLAAAQYSQAVASYQAALRAVGRYFTAAPVAARLAEIERDHPDALVQPVRAGAPVRVSPILEESIRRSPVGP